MNRIICWLVLLPGFAVCAWSAPVVPSITTIPSSGNVSGLPGTTVGWGLTLTYSAPSDWVVLNDSYFTGAQVYGTYNDYIAPLNEFIVAGPAPESSPVTVAFVQGTQGLGEFVINSTAMPGASITGDINVDYTIFSQDPNDPNFDPASFVASGTLSAPVDVTVATAVPEPATFGLLLIAALPFALKGRGFRRRTGLQACPTHRSSTCQEGGRGLAHA